MTNKNKDWREEFDRLINVDTCTPSKTLLRTDEYMHDEELDFFNYPESPYELDEDKVKAYIEQVEADAKKGAYEECIKEIENQAYELKALDPEEYDSLNPDFIHQAAVSNLAIDTITAIKSKYLTKEEDE